MAVSFIHYWATLAHISSFFLKHKTQLWTHQQREQGWKHARSVASLHINTGKWTSCNKRLNITQNEEAQELAGSIKSIMLGKTHSLRRDGPPGRTQHTLFAPPPKISACFRASFCLSSVNCWDRSYIICVCNKFILALGKKKKKTTQKTIVSWRIFYNWMSPHPFNLSSGWGRTQSSCLPPPSYHHIARGGSRSGCRAEGDHTGRLVHRRAIGGGNTGSRMTPSSLAAGYDESAVCGSGGGYTPCACLSVYDDGSLRSTDIARWELWTYNGVHNII